MSALFPTHAERAEDLLDSAHTAAGAVIDWQRDARKKQSALWEIIIPLVDKAAIADTRGMEVRQAVLKLFAELSRTALCTEGALDRLQAKIELHWENVGPAHADESDTRCWTPETYRIHELLRRAGDRL